MSKLGGNVKASLVSAAQETTLALASINFDFSLYKVEAPKEYQSLGNSLSERRRDAAESGSEHTFARRLGALFAQCLPSTPNLIRAYGVRSSEIAASPIVSSQGTHNGGIFNDWMGVDATSIWAAATSGSGALAVHLLACILARAWPAPQAVAIWDELIQTRKKELSKLDTSEPVHLPMLFAAASEITRDQMARWDASARSWLSVADEVKRREQTQMTLLIKDLGLPISKNENVYASVMHAWRSSMETMESIIEGMPQSVSEGAALLGLLSWHLYPNIYALRAQSKYVSLNDGLIPPGAIVTLGALSLSPDIGGGIHWSLPLACLHYYGEPVRTVSNVNDSTRIPMRDFFLVVLGSILSSWGKEGDDFELACTFIIELARFVFAGKACAISGSSSWLQHLASAAETFIISEGLQRDYYYSLVSRGRRRHATLLASRYSDNCVQFGISTITDAVTLCDNLESCLAVLRLSAEGIDIDPNALLIRVLGLQDGSVSVFTPASNLQNEPVVSSNLASQFEYKPAPNANTTSRSIYAPPSPSRSEPWWQPKKLPPRSAPRRRPEKSPPSSAPWWRTEKSPDVSHELQLQDESALNLDLAWGLRDQTLSNFGPAGHQQDEPMSDVDLLTFDEYLWEDDTTASNLTVPSIRWISSSREQTDCIYATAVRQGHNPKKRKVEADEDMTGHFRWVSDPRDHDNKSGEVFKQLTQTITRFDNSGCSRQLLVPYACRSYEFLLGNPKRAAIFKRSGVRATLSDRLTLDVLICMLKRNLFNHGRMVQHLSKLGDSSVKNSSYSNALSALATLANMYHLMPGISVDTGIFTMPVLDGLWVPAMLRNPNCSGAVRSGPKAADFWKDSFLQDLSPLRLSREQAFACIVKLENVNLNLDPKTLEQVMAVSSCNSIYVAMPLVCDPFEQPYGYEMKHIVGNIGRPGLNLLIPPAAPMVRKVDESKWSIVKHREYDGKFDDAFQHTSLHLSFTQYQLPTGSMSHGRQTAEAFFIETLISVYDKGEWVADLDVVGALDRDCLIRIGRSDKCKHKGIERPRFRLTSIDSWEEYLDRPLDAAIFRCNRNWLARLAITALNLSSGRRTILFRDQDAVCWQCISEMFKDPSSSGVSLSAHNDAGEVPLFVC